MNLSLLEEAAAGRTPAMVPLKADQYHRMIESGILPEGEAFELIDGFIVRKDREGHGMVHGTRHVLALLRAARLEHLIVGLEYHLRTQLPIALSDASEPEPDVSIVQGAAENYAEHHPRAADVHLVVEIADHSLGYDRSTKQRLYATAGLLQYWIVNLPDNQLEVYETPVPSEGRYARRTDFGPASVVHLTLGARTINVDVSSLLLP